MAEITAAMAKSLRDRTGAGLMDCKNALAEASGDEEKAIEIIQKKGLAKTAKKAGAIAADGMIHAYIHMGSRLGVLVEINCQTDFVARSPEFKAFAEDVGLQIVASNPTQIRREDANPEDVAKQKRLFEEQIAEEEKTTGKKRPDEAKAKIIQGKLDKWLAESSLEEIVALRDAEQRTIKQLADALSAKTGEKITIRRFVRYELGEGIEKKKADLAAEVAETLKTA